MAANDAEEPLANDTHSTVGGNLGVSRRGFMRATAAAGGAAAVGGAASSPLAPVGRARALSPSVFEGAVRTAGVALGWALREADIIGAQNPPEGLSGAALEDQIYRDARHRQSENASTFIDNRNLVSGIKDNAYVESKIAAIEKLNEGETQQAVQEAAIAKIDEYQTTVVGNLLKSWNESVLELGNLLAAARAHSDVSVTDVLYALGGNESKQEPEVVSPRSYTLANGETMDLQTIEFRGEYYAGSYANTHYVWNPVEIVSRDNASDADGVFFSDSREYLKFTDWNGLFSDIETTFTNVRDGIILWVDSVYGQVQSGEITIEDLLTPRERAAMMTDDEKYPQAVADLIALNIPVDVEREAVVNIPSKDATLTGTFGVTDASQTMETGVTYSPSDFGSVYFTYDLSQGKADWTEYETGVDGGVVTFTAEPYLESRFTIETTAGETATATTDDFAEETDADGNTVWTVDLSGQLDTPITEIASVTVDAGVDETQYETIQITDDFVVQSFTDSDGNEHDSANFENSEPQTDNNYITQDEWDAMADRMAEQIAKYEESQQSGGGGGSGDGWWSEDYYGIPLLGWVAGGLAGLGLLARGGGNQ